MPVYYYRATSRTGEIVDGVLNAPDEKSVIASLKDLKLIPLKISETGKTKSIKLFKGSSGTDTLNFTTELAVLLQAGLALDRALHILSDTSSNTTMKELINSVLNSIRGGSSFSDALSKYPRVFSRLYVSVVRAGELGGVLGQVMDKLAEFLESSKELKDNVLSAMIYPAILVFTGIVSVFILMTFVIPKFSVIFEDVGQALPAPTAFLLFISRMFTSYWWAILIAVVGGSIAFFRFISSENGKDALDRFTYRLLRDIITKLETSRFCRTLGTLLRSGVPLLEALRNVKDVLGNVVMRSSVDKIIKGAREGHGISGLISASGVFPPLAISMIKVGEESGQLDSMLLKVADTYERSLRISIKRFIGIVEPAMILVMAVVVGFIVISMLLAIFSINELPF